jgi:excisionase family DNA binding protein
MEQHTEKLAVSLREAAVMIGISPRTIQNYIRANKLPARKVGRRTVIEVRHLRTFLEADRACAGVPSCKRN